MPASGAARIAGGEPANAGGTGAGGVDANGVDANGIDANGIDAGAVDAYVVEEQVGFLLRRAQQRHTAIFQELIDPPDLTPTQFTALLKAVELGRVTQNHLGRLTAMDPATIQGVVRRLLARGLLRRTHDPADRRTAVLVPTEAGLAAIGPAVASARRITEATLAPLTSEDRRRFLSLLRKMG